MSHILPDGVRTIGALHQNKIELKMMCMRCNETYKVPLFLLALAFSEEFSLVNRNIACPKLKCGGACTILYSDREYAPFRPLREVGKNS